MAVNSEEVRNWFKTLKIVLLYHGKPQKFQEWDLNFYTNTKKFEFACGQVIVLRLRNSQNRG